jgi:putative FmdB family regulatory protein
VPTYQYACTACGHAFEAVQSFSDDALKACPECQGALRKVFSSVGVVFKGSGFYKTDSRTAASSTATSNGSSAPASGDSSPSSSAKTDKADAGSSSGAATGAATTSAPSSAASTD